MTSDSERASSETACNPVLVDEQRIIPTLCTYVRMTKVCSNIWWQSPFGLHTYFCLLSVSSYRIVSDDRVLVCINLCTGSTHECHSYSDSDSDSGSVSNSDSDQNGIHSIILLIVTTDS